MALDPASWLPQAKQLPLGAKRRVQHECGAGRVLIIENKAEGYSAYCFRCSDKGFEPHPAPTLAERIERLSRASLADREGQRSLALPGIPNYDPHTWPLVPRVWLYKAGFSNDKIRELGFYYWGSADRIVMPVYDEVGLVYWQARGFDKGLPKYINPPVDRTTIAPSYGSRADAGLPLVLTEDILSAARVGEVTWAVSLMGTRLSTRVLLMAASSGRRVVVWLDPDSAGKSGASRACSALRNLGISASNLQSELDPKLYSKERISEFLSI